MKPIISEDLRKRISFAAANGSVIAQDLLTAIKRCRDIKNETDKTINYFDSKRKVSNPESGRKTIRIVVTCCRKDLSNKSFPDYGNPQAPYFPENRSEISVHDFAALFKSVREKNYDDPDWVYYDSAMRLASKVKFRIGTTMADFIKAYDASNYIGLSESSQSTLHGSCMRYEETTRNAADYYVNFAGAKILIGETQEGEVVSRAVLWENVSVKDFQEPISFIDRTYTAFDGFLLSAMRREALKAGFLWRKTANDFSTKQNFTPMQDTKLTREAGCDGEGIFNFNAESNYLLNVFKAVPAHRLHKKGCPYCDTMSFLLYRQEQCQLIIANSALFGEKVARLDNTGGYGMPYGHICPVCGAVHNSDKDLCNLCDSLFYEDTIFGRVAKGNSVTYKGKSVPAALFKNKKPIPPFNAYIAIKRICQVNFSL